MLKDEVSVLEGGAEEMDDRGLLLIRGVAVGVGAPDPEGPSRRTWMRSTPACEPLTVEERETVE